MCVDVHGGVCGKDSGRHSSISKGTPRRTRSPDTLSPPHLSTCAEQGGLGPDARAAQVVESAWYLGSSHDSRRGRHVQAAFPKVHEGIVASVLGLDQAVIDFLSKGKQVR